MSHLKSEAELQNKHRRVISQLEKIVANLDNFPKINDQEVDVTELLAAIRSRFKTICSMLNIKQDGDTTEITW